jgi:hypothetical protein
MDSIPGEIGVLIVNGIALLRDRLALARVSSFWLEVHLSRIYFLFLLIAHSKFEFPDDSFKFKYH